MYIRIYVHRYVKLWFYDLFRICLLSRSICSRFSHENIHTRVTRTERRWKPAARPPSSSSSSSPSSASTGSRARKYISWRLVDFAASCTSFHSRCLRHTFTWLNWFREWSTVYIRRFIYIGMFNGKCWSHTGCLIIDGSIE